MERGSAWCHFRCSFSAWSVLQFLFCIGKLCKLLGFSSLLWGTAFWTLKFSDVEAKKPTRSSFYWNQRIFMTPLQQRNTNPCINAFVCTWNNCLVSDSHYLLCSDFPETLFMLLCCGRKSSCHGSCLSSRSCDTKWGKKWNFKPQMCSGLLISIEWFQRVREPEQVTLQKRWFDALSSDNVRFSIGKIRCNGLKQNLEQKHLEVWHYPTFY